MSPVSIGVSPLPWGHILVVEDHQDTRETLCEFLIDAGYLGVPVADGVEALNHLRSGHRPALIILDLMLPRIDGWRFLAIISKEPDLAAIPVVVCSGVEGSRPSDVPADHILEKPIDLDALMALVTRHCGPSVAWSDARSGKTEGRKRARPRRSKKTSED